MKIALYSDLHLESGDWAVPDAAREADVIVLAGDIATGEDGLNWATRAFAGRPVVFVAGNHDFYDYNISLLAKMRAAHRADRGVHFLENRAIEIEGVRYLGCTLWSRFDLYGSGTQQELAMSVARQRINDYWMIRGRAGKRLQPKHTLAMHRASVAWLDAELSTPYNGKTVVVTHFAPHRGCVAPEHEGSAVSPYFVTDLAWLMEKHRIDLWCHGHTHTGTDFIAEGGCRVVSNQLGYPTERRRLIDGIAYASRFRPELLLDV